MSQQCLQRPVTSYIDPTLAQQRVDNYLQNKRPVLTKWINEPGTEESTSQLIPASLFSELADELKKDREGKSVSGVRIYFASYIPDGTAADVYIPKGQEKLLTLIFVPTYQPGTNENDQVNFTDYYIVDYNTGTIVNLNTSVSDINRFAWVTLYQTEEIPVLENAPVKPPVSETQKVWFYISDFIDWADETECRNNNGETVSNVNFKYAAYNDNETFTFKIDDKQFTVSVANQLTLIVSVYPDDVAAVARNAAASSTSGSGGSDYDTSNPCPPAKC